MKAGLLMVIALVFLITLLLVWEYRRAKASLDSEVKALRWLVFAMAVALVALACSQVVIAIAVREMKEPLAKQGAATQARK